jgi:macrolide transport system ATP-binding/permease protein
LTESIILSAAGGLAALAVARWGAGAIVAMVYPNAHDFPIDVSPSPAVLAFAAAVSLLTVVAVGLLPALAGSRSDPTDAMRGAGRVAGGRGSRVRQALVSLQVALSLALVACAGLLAATLYNLQRQDFGFRTDGRYSAKLNASLSDATVEHLEPIYARLADRLAGIPGVASAAFALYGPMEGNNWTSRVTVDGLTSTDVRSASWNRVSPGYFETLGTRLVRGRFLDARDTPQAPAVAVISEAFAARFFGTADPIGKRFGLADRNGGGSRSIEIVGVVGDAKYQDPKRPAYATFFLPFLQHPPGLPATQERAARLSNIAGSVVLRADRPVPGLESDIRRALADVDPGLTLLQVRPLDEQVAGSLRPDRMIASLASGFGAVALLLACLGLYGVVTQAVAGRTREFGVRLAIGATPRRLVATVLRGALLQVGTGVGRGAAAPLDRRPPPRSSSAVCSKACCSASAAAIPASSSPAPRSWRCAPASPRSFPPSAPAASNPPAPSGLTEREMAGGDPSPSTQIPPHPLEV